LAPSSSPLRMLNPLADDRRFCGVGIIVSECVLRLAETARIADTWLIRARRVSVSLRLPAIADDLALLARAEKAATR